MTVNEKETERTRARYQRIAPVYDIMEILAERRFAGWRPRLWSMVKGPDVLEVGVGTGKNLAYYPPGMNVSGIDLTPGMLERAKTRAVALKARADLRVGDVQSLLFGDESFDDVVATFVFCSVPNPVMGLDEIARVLKPDGQLLLLEHVRSAGKVLGALMDLLDPVASASMGAHINRRTVDNVAASRLTPEHVEDLGHGDVFKLIVARKA